MGSRLDSFLLTHRQHVVCPAGQIANAAQRVVQSHTVHILVVTLVHASLTLTACCIIQIHLACSNVITDIYDVIRQLIVERAKAFA